MSHLVVDCRVCRAIPPVADRDAPGGLPPACAELEHLRYDTAKCPLCGTYYRYFYDHDSGGGTSEGGTSETYARLTVPETIVRIRSALHDLPFEPHLTFETDLEQLLREHPDPDETVEISIHRIDDAVLADSWRGNEPAQLAAWSLGRRKAVNAIPTLARALVRGPVRAYAARALATMGTAALPSLLSAFDAGDTPPFPATCALGHLARLEPTLVPEIQRALVARAAAVSPHTYGHEGNSRELAAIVWAIGMCGYSEAALALLVELFARTYGWEREAAIRAIGRRMGKVALPTLIPLLSSTDVYVVEAAIEALTEMGPHARDALPALDACPMRPRMDWRIDRARSTITAPCRICRELPDSADYKPLAFSKLESLAGGDSDLLKCPVCGTYYEYSYEHYPGAPEYTCDPFTIEWLHRRTESEAIEWIEKALRERPGEVKPTLASELVQLQRLHLPRRT